MAWAYVQTIEGFDLDAYDAVSAELGEAVPEGSIFHAAGLYEGKLRIIEVWESEEHFRRFRKERLNPVLTRVIGPEAIAAEWPPPGFEAMEVHQILTGEMDL